MNFQNFKQESRYRELFAGIRFMIIIAQRLIRTIFTIQQIFISLNISIRV